MRPQVQTCLLLLVGVLTSPSTGGTIGNRDDRLYLDGVVGADPSGEDPHANRPLWKTRPGSSHLRNVRASSPGVGGVEESRFTLEQAPTNSALLHTSPGLAQQLGSTEPPMVYRPLLDEDQLVAFELNKLKTTLPPPTNISGEVTAPVAVAVSNQPEGDTDISSQLAELLKSILSESEDQEKSRTQQPRQPPRVDVTSTGKPPEIHEFRPQLEDDLKSVLKLKPQQPQLNATVYLPLQQTAKVPANDSEEDLKHILPTLEETLGSVLKDSEAEVLSSTNRPVLPPLHPTVTDTKQPQLTTEVPLTDAAEDLKHILPSLEEALGGILKDSEAKVPTTTGHSVIPPARPTMTDSKQLPQTTEVPPTDTDEDLKHILPTLEEALGSILKDCDVKVPTTTSWSVIPPASPTTTENKQPPETTKVPPTRAEDDFKHILLALEEAVGSILKDSEAGISSTTNQSVLPSAHQATNDSKQLLKTTEVPLTSAEEDLKHVRPALEEAPGTILKDSVVKVPTTTSRLLLPPLSPTTTDKRQHYSAVRPQPEDTVRPILEKTLLEQEATAQRQTSPPFVWHHRPPKKKDYSFDNFLPE
ncbi:uncharacterized protein LOC126291606 [Schistocerca gregaria]|uniref:uncharacterized protein LOC126291606 n=1 Tax=Schistocerca gregaria TaxID=7010 RepID=UPI00211EBB46|nr:uncharacterized protein LOC126291606 [Schistocerca gregaria]XP_049841099.1 uncharacterized protein LOC126291606 [Schistocerca gregaria]